MPRENRQSSNRELFRAVNDRIAELAATFEAGTQSFICECSQLGCTEQAEVAVDVYARVVDTPGAYLVVAGHEEEDEETIFGSGNYLVVVPSAGT